MALAPGGIVPAKLGFLAIFNPSLGYSDETLDEQIVYYAPVTTQRQKRRHRSRGKLMENLSQERRIQCLRQIGLAQGIIESRKSQYGGQSTVSIDTEHSRVVIHELERDWWIFASLDINDISMPPKLRTGNAQDYPEAVPEGLLEFSYKEIKPAFLLMQELLRAHSIFLLHHSASLSDLFARSRKPDFLSLLGRYWDLFLSTWNVMLQGNSNPVCNMFVGTSLAPSGELGIGIREEERGSSVREALEGLAGRLDGLVDLIVSRFGHYDADGESKNRKGSDSAWLGTGQDPGPEDGAIFLGIGALSRKSVRDVTFWMEDLYTWGENAYGVIDSPISLRAIQRAGKVAEPPSTPPLPTQALATRPSVRRKENGTTSNSDPGSSGSAKTIAERRGQEIGTVEGPFNNVINTAPMPKQMDDDIGHFLIGLIGDVEGGSGSAVEGHKSSNSIDSDSNSRIMLRIMHLELEKTGHNRTKANLFKVFSSSLAHRVDHVSSSPLFGNHGSNKADRLRVVVYAHKPFIFTFFFEPRTDSLAWNSFYKSLHHQLVPLRKPLLSYIQCRPERLDVSSASSTVDHFVRDAAAMIVQSSISSISDHSQAP